MAKSYAEVDSQVINLIGKGTQITGDVVSEGDIRVDGSLDGNLKCSGRVVIGNTGKINGEVSCKNCEVSGLLEGKLVIDQLLSLKSTSKVKGEIKTEKLSIEPGAIYTGSCTMGAQVSNEKPKLK